MFKDQKGMRGAVMMAVAVGLSAGVSGIAAACDFSGGGFFANLVQCAAPNTPVAQAAQTLDTLNGQMGRPFDHAAAAAANSIVPGSQAAIEGAWAIQNNLPRIQAGRAPIVGSLPMPRPIVGNAPMPVGGGRMVLQPINAPMPMVGRMPAPIPMGNYPAMSGYGPPMCVPGYWAPGPIRPIWVPPVCA